MEIPLSTLHIFTQKGQQRIPLPNTCDYLYCIGASVNTANGSSFVVGIIWCFFYSKFPLRSQVGPFFTSVIVVGLQICIVKKKISIPVLYLEDAIFLFLPFSKGDTQVILVYAADTQLGMTQMIMI